MARSKKEWLDNTYAPALKRAPERPVPFETSSGAPIDPLYTAEDFDPRDPEFPGEFPFTRGIRYLLDQGQTGLSVAFDLPTQIGYDADHPLAAGEVGKVGVSICSIEDMDLLFRDIPLDRVTTSMTI